MTEDDYNTLKAMEKSGDEIAIAFAATYQNESDDGRNELRKSGTWKRFAATVKTNAPINDGGSAFPVPNSANVNGQEGMTLRDYFAGKALEAELSKLNIDWRTSALADFAYEVADAMLAARERKEGDQ